VRVPVSSLQSVVVAKAAADGAVGE
jgi:hypothetical protein